MQDWNTYFKGKKITVMGLGLLGRGVGGAEFLAEYGAELIVTDLKSAEELAPSLKRLEGFSNITYRLGGHDTADFKERDFVLKAAGVPLDSPYIAEAKKNGVSVKMSASWFAELTNIPIVGVTGTRGKSTVTHLIHHILKEAKLPVLLGGNVRGVSTLSLLRDVRENSVGVFELDSWQCHGFGEARISPHIAVFTTLYEDHLNYYDDAEAYLQDKAQIFLNQTSADTLIVSVQVAETIMKTYGAKIKSRIIVANPAHFPDHWQIRIPGTHNLLNASCATEAARALSVPEERIQEGIATFVGVPGRLELLGEVDGIRVYNDTTATTPDATVSALYALPGKRLVLIMGGSDKGIDMKQLVKMIPVYVGHVVLLEGTGTRRLIQEFPALFSHLTVHQSLQSAFAEALMSSKPGDCILFSPAFASFGMFKNEFDRGDQFVQLVKSLSSP